MQGSLNTGYFYFINNKKGYTVMVSGKNLSSPPFNVSVGSIINITVE